MLGWFHLAAQNLNISTAGDIGPTSGTNWSISGNTLNVGASGTANVHPDVISNHLNNTGNLTIVLPVQASVTRNILVNGTITYTGTATRALTFNAANEFFMTTANQSISATNGALNVVIRTGMGSQSPNEGRAVI